MKDFIMFAFGVIASGAMHFTNSFIFMLYSGAAGLSKHGRFRAEFGLLHRLWILFCIIFVSIVPICILIWNPLDASEQWVRLGAFISFVYIEIKFKAISILTRSFINGYNDPSDK